MNRALILLLLVGVVYGFGLGAASLWDIDEAIYADIARNMAESGDWVFPVWNYGPRFDKPPLMFWIGAAAMRLVGPSELAARVGSYLFALCSIALVYAFGAKLYSRRAGVLGALVLASTLGWFIAGRIGLMDTALSFFIGLALYLLAATEREQGVWERLGIHSEGAQPLLVYACLGAALALGVLTKGPVAVVLFGGAALVYLGLGPLVKRFLSLGGLASAGAFFAIALPWHLAIYARAGQAWWESYFGYHMFARFTQALEEHGYGWYFYLIVLAVGLLPWTGHAVAGAWSGLRSALENRAAKGRERLLVGWFAVVLVFFSISSTKLPGYILPAFLPLAVLTGAWCDQRLSRPGGSRAFSAGLWASVAAGVLAGVGLFALRPLVPEGYEAAYRLLFVFPAALVTGMLATFAAWLFFRKPEALLYGFGGTAFAGMLLFSGLMTPLIEEFKPVKPLSLAALNHLEPRTALVSAMGDASANFYTRREVIYVHDPKEVRTLLAARPDVLALVPEAMLDSLADVEVLAVHGPGALVRPVQ